jgi:hypothetical protein
MKCTWVINGRIQLAITAESELEKQLLQTLTAGQIENQWFDKVTISDKALVDTVILTPAPVQPNKEGS